MNNLVRTSSHENYQKENNYIWYIMKDTIALCDECGERFLYPSEGQVDAGFGVCHQCYLKLLEYVKKKKGD